MNIFTRKKKLLEANRKLAVLLKSKRGHLEYFIQSAQDRSKEIEELQERVKEPLRIILVDERRRND